jgi:hypothetical protein
VQARNQHGQRLFSDKERLESGELAGEKWNEPKLRQSCAPQMCESHVPGTIASHNKLKSGQEDVAWQEAVWNE